MQVEVKIDDSRQKPTDSILSDLIIEAKLFDTSIWYNKDGHVDLLSSNVSDLKFNNSSSIHGFHDFILDGKLERPRLWSAEYVRKL